MSEPTVKINKEKKTMTITLPLESEPTPSKSGKSLTVASTRGNQRTDTKVDGKNLTVSVNAYVKAD